MERSDAPGGVAAGIAGAVRTRRGPGAVVPASSATTPRQTRARGDTHATRSVLLVALCLAAGTASSPPAVAPAEADPSPKPHLTPFADEQAFGRPLAGWAERARVESEQRMRRQAVQETAMPDSDRRGIVGLPIVGLRRGNTVQRYLDESASVLYLRNRDLRLTRMGELLADADRAVDDGCRAGCVDWYGNARPVFVGERVFALLGYELVEGRVSGERVVERRRASFAPGAAIAD